jgi:hypothetical protein
VRSVAASSSVPRSLRPLLAALALALVLVASPAGAQTEPSPTTTAFDLSNCTGAIERPGCGEKPESAGDRGGALQLGLFLFIALGTATGLVYVASRVRKGTRARAESVTGDWS